jgi:hypothetical protein
MTSGASPKARILAELDRQRKTLDEAPTQEEYTDPGAILIADAILLLVEVELLR